MEFFPGTQERVRNSRGKRAISVRVTEVLLYSVMRFWDHKHARPLNLTKCRLSKNMIYSCNIKQLVEKNYHKKMEVIGKSQ